MVVSWNSQLNLAIWLDHQSAQLGSSSCVMLWIYVICCRELYLRVMLHRQLLLAWVWKMVTSCIGVQSVIVSSLRERITAGLYCITGDCSICAVCLQHKSYLTPPKCGRHAVKRVCSFFLCLLAWLLQNCERWQLLWTGRVRHGSINQSINLYLSNKTI